MDLNTRGQINSKIQKRPQSFRGHTVPSTFLIYFPTPSKEDLP